MSGRKPIGLDTLPSGKTRVRYTDGDGKRHAATFDTAEAARKFLDAQRGAVATGEHVPPSSGRQTFRAYADTWRAAQVHRPSTAAHVEGQLRRHVYPVLGDKPISAIKPSTIQTWVKRLESDGLAPRTVAVLASIVGGIFRSAVIDGDLAKSPFVKIKRTKPEPREVEPLTTDTVQAIADAMPRCLSAMVITAAGTGLRLGEIAGLTVDRIDFLGHRGADGVHVGPTVRVNRQLSTVDGRTPFLSRPKTDASFRTVPLPAVIVDTLAAHLAAYPARVHDVPTDSSDGELVPVELIFTSARGYPLRRTTFGDVFRTAATDAGAPVGTGFHALRHYYASLLIRHGESVKVVQARLGHSTAAETLDTYSHLWPDSDDQTRDAIDSVLGRVEVAKDGHASGHGDSVSTEDERIGAGQSLVTS